jgi:hypothetical protein
VAVHLAPPAPAQSDAGWWCGVGGHLLATAYASLLFLALSSRPARQLADRVARGNAWLSALVLVAVFAVAHFLYHAT